MSIKGQHKLSGHVVDGFNLSTITIGFVVPEGQRNLSSDGILSLDDFNITKLVEIIVKVCP
jgi:hypothetical protein